jgi:hypothetical protein
MLFKIAKTKTHSFDIKTEKQLSLENSCFEQERNGNAVLQENKSNILGVVRITLSNQEAFAFRFHKTFIFEKEMDGLVV